MATRTRTKKPAGPKGRTSPKNPASPKDPSNPKPRKERIALYPGTFDPVTYGHLDVIERASGIFDRVVVLIAKNTAKSPLFPVADRVAMVRAAAARHENVSVDVFEGLLVNYAKTLKATAIIRGLRAVSDFEYEFQMALANRKLAPGVTTVFLMPDEKYTYLNSSLVREIATFGGNVSSFVPPAVRRKITERVGRSAGKRKRTG